MVGVVLDSSYTYLMYGSISFQNASKLSISIILYLINLLTFNFLFNKSLKNLKYFNN